MRNEKHINRALPTAGHTPMYIMHKFFARKQEDVICEYIKIYSKEGDIVLDPFCGSGVMVAEALKLDRRAIGIDINPVSIFISKNTIKHLEITQIKNEFESIKNDIANEIDNLYLTKCRKCTDNRVPAICFTWDKGKLVDVRYECPHHGKLISPIDEEDLELYESVKKGSLSGFFDTKGNIKYWYPKNKLYYSDGTPFLKKERFDSIDEIFTKRNLIALAKLYSRIKEIEDEKLKNGFKFAFSSLTHLASSMTPVRPSRPFSSAWVQQSYWAVPNFMESNVWNLFKSAVTERQGLIKAKANLPYNLIRKKEASTYEQFLERGYDYLLITHSAIDALNNIEEDSIDYIITDPPYGHSIQYGELLFMWGCWQKLFENIDFIAEGEIIENPKQGKNIEQYENMLYVAFREIFRVLKPGKYCTITFHNPHLKYRNILFKSVVMAGFEFEKIIYQPPPRASAKSKLQPFGSLEGDYFFRFKKPTEHKIESLKTIDERRVETLIVNTAKKIIAERGEPTPYTFIQNSIDPLLYEELRKYGLVLDFQPESVEEILKRYVGEIFQLVDIVVGRTKQKTLLGKGWWFVDPNAHRLDIPLNKRIDESISNLLRRERVVSYTEVLTEVYTRFQNSLTPEENTIMTILTENATKTREGRWRIKPFVERIGREHEKMVYLLSLLGIKAGYKVSIAKDELGKFYDRQRLDSIIELTELKLTEVNSDQIERIRSIDVIWHKGNKIIASFEVEHSTSIVDAIVRGANIPTKDVKRMIIIPEEREDLAHRRFKEPAIKSMMLDMDWDIITYKETESFLLQNKKKSTINDKEFFALARKPISDMERKNKLQTKLM